MTSFRARYLSLPITVLAVAGFTTSASAEALFAGKTIQMVVASSAGGGTDRVGRLFGLYLTRNLPGEPSMVYRNMGAGGGKIRAANYLALQAKPDGMTIMQTDSSTVQPHNVRRKVAKYDPRKFIAVGGFNAGGSVIFMRKGLKDRLKGFGKPVIVGAISGSRSWQAMTVWAKEYLGWNLRWIPGYKGTRSLMKAIRQGEIDMMATASSKRINRLVKDKVVDLIAQEGLGGRGNFKSRKSYPAVPILPAMLEAKKMSEKGWAGYQSWIGASQVDKWLALPPKTPQKYVRAYRAAFDKVVADKAFIKLLKKTFSKDAVILNGAQVQAIIKDVQGVSNDAIKFARSLRKKYGLSSR